VQPSDYPPQEPLSEPGQKYSAECFRRSEGITGPEFSYGTDPYQSILVFPATQPTGHVLVCWHGGGWTSGYKEWMAFMAPPLNARGITLVSPGYRLAPGHLFPTGFDDCARAVQWVHQHIATHGGDPGRIFLGGHSAGGHYAALLAVRDDWQTPLGLPADVVRGALPLSGVYDFTATSGLTMRPRFLGADGNEAPASPLTYVRAGRRLPPFLLAHGSQDFPHLMTQAARFETAVRDAGNAVSRIVFDDRNHFSAHYAGGEADGPWVGAAIDFMRRYA